MKKISILTFISIFLMQLLAFADEALPDEPIKRITSSSFDTFTIIKFISIGIIVICLVAFAIHALSTINKNSNNNSLAFDEKEEEEK